jgi:hypothetical protein
MIAHRLRIPFKVKRKILITLQAADKPLSRPNAVYDL